MQYIDCPMQKKKLALQRKVKNLNVKTQVNFDLHSRAFKNDITIEEYNKKIELLKCNDSQLNVVDITGRKHWNVQNKMNNMEDGVAQLQKNISDFGLRKKQIYERQQGQYIMQPDKKIHQKDDFDPNIFRKMLQNAVMEKNDFYKQAQFEGAIAHKQYDKTRFINFDDPVVRNNNDDKYIQNKMIISRKSADNFGKQIYSAQNQHDQEQQQLKARVGIFNQQQDNRKINLGLMFDQPQQQCKSKYQKFIQHQKGSKPFEAQVDEGQEYLHKTQNTGNQQHSRTNFSAINVVEGAGQVLKNFISYIVKNKNDNVKMSQLACDSNVNYQQNKQYDTGRINTHKQTKIQQRQNEQDNVCAQKSKCIKRQVNSFCNGTQNLVKFANENQQQIQKEKRIFHDKHDNGKKIKDNLICENQQQIYKEKRVFYEKHNSGKNIKDNLICENQQQIQKEQRAFHNKNTKIKNNEGIIHEEQQKNNKCIQQGNRHKHQTAISGDAVIQFGDSQNIYKQLGGSTPGQKQNKTQLKITQHDNNQQLYKDHHMVEKQAQKKQNNAVICDDQNQNLIMQHGPKQKQDVYVNKFFGIIDDIQQQNCKLDRLNYEKSYSTKQNPTLIGTDGFDAVQNPSILHVKKPANAFLHFAN